MRLRAVVVALALAAAGVFAVQTAQAEHCPDQPGLDENWCHESPPNTSESPEPPPNISPSPTPTGTGEASATPAATTAPTTAPTSAPTRTSAPVARTSPAPTSDIEVPAGPTSPRPSIIIPSIAPGGDEIPDPENQGTGVAANMAFFIVGFILGAIVGRASWGFSRRRKKQHIFG